MPPDLLRLHLHLFHFSEYPIHRGQARFSLCIYHVCIAGDYAQSILSTIPMFGLPEPLHETREPQATLCAS